MPSLKLSIKACTATAARLAAVIVMALCSLGATWVQEPVQPRIDQQFEKQERIYQRQGTRGYTANRGLVRYSEVLHSGFCEALAGLGGSDRWLDVGAGEGQAILDYYTPPEKAAAEKCRGSGPKAAAVAISIEDRRTNEWQERAASAGEERLRYFFGKRLRQYSNEELGKFQIITDVYGGFTYTENLSQFVEKALGSLEVGGAFYSVLPAVRLEDGSDKLGTWYKTELVDAGSRPVKVCSWLKQSACTKVSCETMNPADEPTQLIKIQKICADVALPRTNLVEYIAGSPPNRRFQLAP